MDQQQRSRTAEMAAAVRAIHYAHESPVVFADPYAGRLAGPVWRILTKSRLLYLLGIKIIYSGLDPIRRQIIARARYAEDKMEAALESGIDQYVIIGAGLDSFALRKKDLAKRLHVYELDHPISQQSKRERIDRLKISLPEKYEFVPVDFEKEGVDKALARSSYNPGHLSFFSWLGSVHYISSSAVFDTIQSISTYAHPGSELVFDYAVSDQYIDGRDQKMFKKLKRITARRGEPIISQFNPHDLSKQVSMCGFELTENLSPTEQADRYFRKTDGKPSLMPATYFAHFRLQKK